jgi:hypothetical protein
MANHPGDARSEVADHFQPHNGERVRPHGRRRRSMPSSLAFDRERRLGDAAATELLDEPFPELVARARSAHAASSTGTASIS